MLVQPAMTVQTADPSPVWVPRIRGFSGGPGFAAVVTACLASGIWLTALASADHAIIVRKVWSWTALMVEGVR